MRIDSLLKKARVAGEAAAEACVPVPMVVGSAKSLFGNEMDPNKPVYHVPDGVCGFAWVEIHPARGAVVSYMKKNRIGCPGYPKGWSVWVSGYGQSMQKKEAYAGAYAKVLRDDGGLDARCVSRMD